MPIPCTIGILSTCPPSVFHTSHYYYYHHTFKHKDIIPCTLRANSFRIRSHSIDAFLQNTRFTQCSTIIIICHHASPPTTYSVVHVHLFACHGHAAVVTRDPCDTVHSPIIIPRLVGRRLSRSSHYYVTVSGQNNTCKPRAVKLRKGYTTSTFTSSIIYYYRVYIIIIIIRSVLTCGCVNYNNNCCRPLFFFLFFFRCSLRR